MTFKKVFWFEYFTWAQLEWMKTSYNFRWQLCFLLHIKILIQQKMAFEDRNRPRQDRTDHEYPSGMGQRKSAPRSQKANNHPRRGCDNFLISIIIKYIMQYTSHNLAKSKSKYVSFIKPWCCIIGILTKGRLSISKLAHYIN